LAQRPHNSGTPPQPRALPLKSVQCASRNWRVSTYGCGGVSDSAAAFCIWRRALPRSRPHRGSQWRKPIRRGVSPWTRMRTVPGSPITISRAAADDFFNAPDWRPDLHPAMPKIVQYGNKDTQLRACGSCHLPTGNGHDESAYLAGLPVTYFMRQWPTGRAATASTAASWSKSRSSLRRRGAHGGRVFRFGQAASVDPGCRDRHVPKSFVGPGNKRLEPTRGRTFIVELTAR
jgi:hypothetical protein